MRAVLLFFLAVCVVSALGQRTAVDLWFNEVTPNYQAGYVSLPVLKLGNNGAVAVEANCFLQRLVNNERNTLMFFGPRSSSAGEGTRSVADDIELFLINQGTSTTKVGVRVGSETFTTSSTVDVNKKWAYLAVNVYNKGSAAVVEVYVNGVQQSLNNGGVTSSFSLRAVARDYNFLGYSPVSSGFRGLVDTVQIWDKQLSLATIQAHAAYTNGDFPWSPAGLIVRFDFSEGSGLTTRGRVGQAGTTTYVASLAYPRAVFSSGSETGWIYCNGWGDPHYRTYYTDDGAYAAFDTQHVTGYFNLVGCKNSAGERDFQVSSWHIANAGGYYTINRAMSIRQGQSMFQYSSSVGIANGHAGPYVYKEIPIGADPASVPWQSLSRGASATLASGMVIDIDAGSGSVEIYAAPYARISIANAGSYCDYTMYINAGGCDSREIKDAVCKGHTDPVSSWVFVGTPNPPPPFTPAAPIAAPPPGPECTPTLNAIAETNCKRCFPKWETTEQTEYQQCITDVCFTGNPYCPVPQCQPGEVCCTCASTGTCLIAADNSTTCDCDEGYGGSDCSQSLTLVELKLTTTAKQMFDGLDYPLAAHSFDDIDRVNALDGAALVQLNPWVVKNSLLVYVATVNYATENGLQPAQHLYVVSDASSFTGSWTNTLSMTYTGFDAYTGTAAAFNGAATLGGAAAGIPAATASFVTRPTSNTGFVIPNLPAEWCVTFTTDFADSVAQTVVGSGNIRGQLELLRVVDSNQGFKVCGEKRADPCPELTDCKTCTANAACGWCRTTGQCHFGRPAGPTDGSVCPAWAFTFAEVTRRITQTYGYPVSPVDTTVVLSAADSTSLPIEIKVDMAYRYYTAWDIQLLFPNSATNGADLAGLKSSIQDIADRLSANYLNSALSVATYSSRLAANTAEPNGDNIVFSQVFPLVSTASSASMYDALQSVSTNGRSGAPHLSAVALPRFVGLANNRKNARTLVVVFATQADANIGSAGSALASLFTKASAMPVFIVSPAVKAQYQALVTDIGFGLVLDYTSPSAIALAIDRALTDASGATFLAVDQEHVGPIKTSQLDDVIASLTVTGMSSQMRSRNNFPINSDVGNNEQAVILVPGFGKATIETVESDSPYTTGPAINMVVGQALDPYTADVSVPAALAHLTGNPADVLQSTALVSASVKAVSRGQLYQFNETALRAGVLVSGLVPVDFANADTEGYVAVTDVLGRLVYNPPENQFGTGDAAYATITYRVNDECSNSPDGSIPVYVAYANNKPPTTAAKAVNTAENTPVRVTLTATDYRAHTLSFVFPTTPVNAAGSAALAGKIYRYSAACWAAVSDDIADVAACTEITAGASVDGTPSAGAQSTTISTVEIIYVPYKYANSEGIPSVYLAQPTISYTAVQLANENDVTPFVALTTSVATFGVNISAVNQAPFAYKPAEASSWLSFDASSFLDITTGCRASNDPAVTTVVCNYDQNLGVDYPSIPAPISLYALAFDVDSDPLSIIVNSVTCPTDAILTNVVNGFTVRDGMTVNDNHAADTWAPAINFRPSQDGSGDPYCTVSYVVSDGELESPVQTIKINITGKPLPPRSANQRFFAPTIAPLAVQITAGAVDERKTSGVVHHYIRKAEITACSGDLTSTLVIAPNTAALDCATVSTSAPYVVNVESNEADDSNSLYGTGMMHVFNGNWTPTAASTVGFAVTVRFTDDQQLVSNDYTMSFSYRQVNQAPEFQWVAGGESAQWYNDQTQSVGLRLIQGGASASISFNARDIDSEDGMVVLTVDHNLGVGNNQVTFGSAGDEGWVIKTATGIVATAPMASIDAILSSLSVNVANGGNKLEFQVKIQVDDNGFSGACSQVSVTPCSKYGTATINVAASAPANVVAIGLAAGAGGAAVAAAGAAAIAWRALRTPPTETYNPWEMDDNNEGTVMNPLFEGTGNSGGNPMFEGAVKP